jgi:hypothetical protein
VSSSNDEREDWQADWEGHRRWQLTAALASTPAQRLAWLEEALRFAAAAGALPLRTESDDESGG